MFRFLHYCMYKQPALGVFFGAGFASIYFIWSIACGKKILKAYEEGSTTISLGK